MFSSPSVCASSAAPCCIKAQSRKAEILWVHIKFLVQSKARRSRPFSDNPLNFVMLISTEMAILSNFSNLCFEFYWKGFPFYFQSCQRYILAVFWYSNIDVNPNNLEKKMEGKSSLRVPISKSWEEGRTDRRTDRLLFTALEGWVLGELDSGPCLPGPEQYAFPLFVSVSMFTEGW